MVYCTKSGLKVLPSKVGLFFSYHFSFPFEGNVGKCLLSFTIMMFADSCYLKIYFTDCI